MHSWLVQKPNLELTLVDVILVRFLVNGEIIKSGVAFVMAKSRTFHE